MIENLPNIVRTSVRMRGDLHDFLADRVHNLKRRRQKASIDAEVNRAVEVYKSSLAGGEIRETAPGTAVTTRVYSNEEQEQIDKLVMILRAGDPGAIEAVKRNLDTFERLVRMLQRRATGRERRPA